MQEDTNKKEYTKDREDLEITDLSLDDRQSLVSVFAWLIQEDKKQNPDLYKSKKQNRKENSYQQPLKLISEV